MTDFAGQTEIFVSEDGEHTVVCEPYEGKLVLTAHSTTEQLDPHEITRQLDRWMRDNNLSRVEAYWNSIPGEDD